MNRLGRWLLGLALICATLAAMAETINGFDLADLSVDRARAPRRPAA